MNSIADFITTVFGLKIYISVNEFSHGYIDICIKNKSIHSSNFEFPYYIAESVAYSLSHLCHTELEDELYNNRIYLDGKEIEKKQGEK